MSKDQIIQPSHEHLLWARFDARYLTRHYVILSTTAWEWCNIPEFTDEKTKAQKSVLPVLHGACNPGCWPSYYSLVVPPKGTTNGMRGCNPPWLATWRFKWDQWAAAKVCLHFCVVRVPQEPHSPAPTPASRLLQSPSPKHLLDFIPCVPRPGRLPLSFGL